jgi:hypothetical protein
LLISIACCHHQGMSCAAVGAVALERCAARALAGASGGADGRRQALRAMGPRFQARLAKDTEICWGMACSEDMQ